MSILRLAIIRRYWLSLVVSLFCLLVLTVDDQERVLAQLPTPDVNTVPDLQDLYTRTPTPTAVPVVIVTATPASPATGSTNGQTDGPTTGSTDGSTDGSTAGNAGEEPPTTKATSDPATTTNGEIPAISASSIEGAAASPTTRAGTVNIESLNVREAPNTTSKVIDLLVRNTRVTLLQQDATLRWWYICCGSTNKLQGWVSAQYLTIDAVAPGGLPDQLSGAGAQLALQIQLLPKQRFVWQGQPLTVQVVLANPKPIPIRQVTIRADLPPEIHFVDATTSLAGSQQVDNQSTEHTVVVLSWPEIAAKTQVVATLNLQIATTVANGSFIDLIAAVDATGEATTVTGISVIMPPNRLPTFP